MTARHRRQRTRPGVASRYPRSARVNEVLRQVVAEELERLGDQDERLRLLTVTAVETQPDLRHATVWLDTMDEPAGEALAAVRVKLQAAIGRQVRLKHTPQLSFGADPAVASGRRVEEVLRVLAQRRPPGDGRPEER
jgi:ribosome-binding factor A